MVPFEYEKKEPSLNGSAQARHPVGAEVYAYMGCISEMHRDHCPVRGSRMQAEHVICLRIVRITTRIVDEHDFVLLCSTSSDEDSSAFIKENIFLEVNFRENT